MQIFLIRHPRPAIAEGVCYGQLDIDCLDAQSAAERLREFLPPDLPVLSSPLARARQLAEALHATPSFDTRLAEISFGDWEGQRWESIAREQLDAWVADVLHFTPPGGESAAMLQARAIACAADFAGENHCQQLALVTHSGVMRALIGHWLQLPVAEWSTLQFAFGSATLVELEAQGAALRYANR